MSVPLRLATILTLLLAPLAQPPMAAECATDVSGHGSHEHGRHAPEDAPEDGTLEEHGEIPEQSDLRSIRGDERVDEPDDHHHHAPANCAHATCGISLPTPSAAASGTCLQAHTAPLKASPPTCSVDLSQDPPPPRLPG